MHHALDYIKYPKMKVVTGHGSILQFSIASKKARFPGSLNITNGCSYSDGNSVFYGRIKRDGTLQPYRDAPIELRDAITTINRNPKIAAQEYAKLTSSCCFCQLKLTRADSIFYGYGLHCAKHYDLPFSRSKYRIKQADVKLNSVKVYTNAPYQLNLDLLKTGSR